MSWYTIFYWISIAEKLQLFVQVIAIIASVVLGIALLVNIIANFSYAENTRSGGTDGKNLNYIKYTKKIFKVFIPIFTFFWLFYILVPSKEDTILIVAGGSIGNFITSDSSSKQIPSEITSFLRVKIQELASDAKLNLGIIDHKQQALKDLDHLTKDEIIERLKTDSTISKLTP